jgi:hypothetical protein
MSWFRYKTLKFQESIERKKGERFKFEKLSLKMQ